MLTAGISAMATSRGIEVVADGMGTEGQHAVLLGLDCGFAQGWLRGQPMP